MNTRGRGRLFQRERSSYWWISYYAHGKEEREVARHVRTGEKIEAMEKNRHEAERWLKRVGRFGFLTGWRKGSIESLRWSDVGDGVIYLQAKNSKGRKAETMPLEGELGAIIERRRSAQVLEDGNGTNRLAEFVFHRDGQPIGDFRKAWATARKKANVDHKLFHDLRRTASRNMIVAGVPKLLP